MVQSHLTLQLRTRTRKIYGDTITIGRVQCFRDFRLHLKLCSLIWQTLHIIVTVEVMNSFKLPDVKSQSSTPEVTNNLLTRPTPETCILGWAYLCCQVR